MTDAHGLYPMLVAVSPVLDAADIVAAATGVIKAKLHSLWENPNAHYWREVVHVVWEQLPSTPGSVAANTGSTPPTTPSGTGSASGNNTAWIDALEAKVLALKKELVVKSHQLDDTWHKVSSLCDIVENLWQEHCPLAQGLMGPIQTPQ
ncbi:hypothetical protein J3A83DRAFT_4411484 [Scleroderma citrinum]